MAKKPTLTDLTGSYSAQSLINNNNTEIETAFDNTISRDGSSPNQMEADLDLNSNDLLNVKELDVQSLSVQGVTFTPTNVTTIPDWEGAWLTATAYAVNDLVQESGNTYICVVAHTSGTFATDLAAVKWELFASKGAAGAGDMLAANNLSDVSSASTSRTNLGLGSLATASNFDIVNDTTPQLGGPLDANGKTVGFSRGADVASASELLLLTDGNVVVVTGFATINTIETTANAIPVGSIYFLTCAAGITFKHDLTKIDCITSADIVTEDQDTIIMLKKPLGVWKMLFYQRADGSSLTEPTVPVGINPSAAYTDISGSWSSGTARQNPSSVYVMKVTFEILNGYHFEVSDDNVSWSTVINISASDRYSPEFTVMPSQYWRMTPKTTSPSAILEHK